MSALTCVIERARARARVQHAGCCAGKCCHESERARGGKERASPTELPLSARPLNRGKRCASARNAVKRGQPLLQISSHRRNWIAKDRDAETSIFRGARPAIPLGERLIRHERGIQPSFR